SWPANPPINPGGSENCFISCTGPIRTANSEGPTASARTRPAAGNQRRGRSGRDGFTSSAPTTEVPGKAFPTPSAFPVTSGQLLQHFVQRKLRLPQKHEEMKKQIGRFVPEFLR